MTANNIADEKTSYRIYPGISDSSYLYSAEEQLELVKRAKAGDALSTEKLIFSCVKMIIFIAKKYSSTSVCMEDYTQEGIIGVMVAIEKFNVESGIKFSSYAYYWIQQRIRKYTANNDLKLTITPHDYDYVIKCRQAIAQFQDENSILPTEKELAELTKMPLEIVKDVYRATVHTYSMDSQIINGSGSKSDDFYKLVQDTEAIDPEEYSLASETAAEVWEALKTLSEREQQIIIDRYMLDGRQKRSTYVELGKKLNLSRERINKLEEAAKHKMFLYMEKKRRGLDTNLPDTVLSGYMTISQAAKYINISQTKIRALIIKNIIQTKMFDGKMVVDWASLKAYRDQI